VLRVVLDPGVLIAGLISREGAPAQTLGKWMAGDFQVVCSPMLIAEFLAVAQRAKFRKYFSIEQAFSFAELMQMNAEFVNDQETSAESPLDAGDAYLVHLVVSAKAFAVVTGDRDLAAHQVEGFKAIRPRSLIELLATLP